METHPCKRIMADAIKIGAKIPRVDLRLKSETVEGVFGVGRIRFLASNINRWVAKQWTND